MNISTEQFFHILVNRLQNLLLGIHADGLERLPGAAVRADEGLVVLSGKRRSAVVDPATKRADCHPCDVILPPCIYCSIIQNVFVDGLALHKPFGTRQKVLSRFTYYKGRTAA